MANTDYQGEIKGNGDTVIIRKTPAITIRDYTVGMDLDYEVPVVANTTLAIDQAKSWAFRLDDIDAVATDLPLMEKFAADAGERLKIAIDSDCLEYVVGKADSDNSGAAAGAVSGGFDMGEADAPLSITATNAVETIVYANAVLDEANIPSENRYMIIPAWFAAMLKTSDLRAANIQ